MGGEQRFNGRTLSNAETRLSGRKGIIYFNNCFRREQGGAMVGDHIDLWTGVQYYNQILRLSAGGNVPSNRSLFNRADAVWFFPLSR